MDGIQGNPNYRNFGTLPASSEDPVPKEPVSDSELDDSELGDPELNDPVLTVLVTPMSSMDLLSPVNI
jgi:hypothetical protein